MIVGGLKEPHASRTTWLGLASTMPALLAAENAVANVLTKIRRNSHRRYHNGGSLTQTGWLCEQRLNAWSQQKSANFTNSTRILFFLRAELTVPRTTSKFGFLNRR
jgi:hypothetical protein